METYEDVVAAITKGLTDNLAPSRTGLFVSIGEKYGEEKMLDAASLFVAEIFTSFENAGGDTKALLRHIAKGEIALEVLEEEVRSALSFTGPDPLD